MPPRGRPVAGQEEIAQAGVGDQGHAFPKNEDRDDHQGTDGRQGEE